MRSISGTIRCCRISLPSKVPHFARGRLLNSHTTARNLDVRDHKANTHAPGPVCDSTAVRKNPRRLQLETLESRFLLTGWLEVEPNDLIGSATALTIVEDPIGSGMLTVYGQGARNPATSGNTWSDPDYW